MDTAALKAAKSTKAPRPSSAGVPRPLAMGVPAMMAGRTKTGRASSPPMPSNEKAVSPATAVAGSFPASASIRNWVAAPKAAPPGTIRLMALPDSCDVVTENHALVRSAIRCSAMVRRSAPPGAPGRR